MKKFASLLAIAAALAFASASFAEGIAASDGIAKYDGTNEINNSFTAGTGNNATGKVYYFGDTVPQLRIGAKLKADADYSSSSGKYTATVGTNTAIEGVETVAVNTDAADQSFTVPAGQISATGETDVVFKVNTSGGDKADTATLKITPVKVELEIPGPIIIEEGTETTEVQIKLKNESLTPTFSGDGFKADSPPGNSPTITPGLNRLVINAANADPGTYVFEVKTQPGTSMTVDEDGGASGIAVANFPTGEIAVCEMTVIIDGYEATPSSADWDITSPTSVKFKVDMKYDDFDGIGLKKPNDTDGTAISDIDTEFYTVMQTADGIEIEIALEYLVEQLTEIGDYVFNVADKDNRQAYFTLRVKGKYQIPEKGVDAPSDADTPPAVQFGIDQSQLYGEDLVEFVESMPEDMKNYFDGNGNVYKEDVVQYLIRVDEDDLTVLPFVETTLSEDKRIAAFTFGVAGHALVSEGIDGIHWYDAIIHKMFARGDSTAAATLAPARTWGAIANGTYMILDESGKLLAADYVIKRDHTQYKLVVYVEDNSDYDLDKTTPRRIVDPVAIQAYSGGRGSSSSGCEMGIGLAALVGLAAIATRKRRK